MEEKVLEAAKNKLKLEQLVISKGKFKNVGKKTDKDDKLKVLPPSMLPIPARLMHGGWCYSCGLSAVL